MPLSLTNVASGYPILKNLILNDLPDLGLANRALHGDDQGITDLLSQNALTFSPAKTWTARQPLIDINWVLQWSAPGPYEAIDTATTMQAAPSGHPTAGEAAELRSLSKAALRLFNLSAPFNVDSPTNTALLGAFVAFGVLQSADVASLSALADMPCSYAEYTYGYGTTINNGDVSYALRGQI